MSGPDVQATLLVPKHERAAWAADTRVDDRQVDADRHEADRVREDEGALEDCLRRDPVRDVDDLRLRGDALHDAVASTDEIVLEPEVAQERDEHARRLPPYGSNELAAALRARRRAAPEALASQSRRRDARPRGRIRTKAVGAWSGSGRPTWSGLVTPYPSPLRVPRARAQHSRGLRSSLSRDRASSSNSAVSRCRRASFAAMIAT